MEMNLGDFYRKHLDGDKFQHWRRFMASKMTLFSSTYVCEQFFKLGFMKSLRRSVLTDEHLENGLRVTGNLIKVNLDRVVGKINQLQISHYSDGKNLFVFC